MRVLAASPGRKHPTLEPRGRTLIAGNVATELSSRCMIQIALGSQRCFLSLALGLWAACGPDHASRAMPDWSAVPVTLNAVDQPLERIVDIVVDGSGRMIVGDAGASKLLIVDSIGSAAAMLGRPGEGPGEYRFITTVDLLSGDSLFVYDGILQRATIYAPPYADVAATVDYGNAIPPLPFWATATRSRHVVAVYSQPVSPTQAGPRMSFVRVLSPQGAILADTVAFYPGSKPVTYRTPGSVVSAGDPFSRRGIVRVSDSELIYVGHTEQSQVRVYRLDGSLARTIDINAVARPVLPEEVDSIAERLAPELRPVLRADAPVYWPLFRDFVVDEQDQLWVRSEAALGEPEAWTVYGEHDEAIARVIFPVPIEIKHIKGRQIYGVVLSEFDEPRVAVFRTEVGQ